VKTNKHERREKKKQEVCYGVLQEDPRGDEEGHAPYSCDSHVVYPAYTQNLPANCRAMLLSDTGGKHCL